MRNAERVHAISSAAAIVAALALGLRGCSSTEEDSSHSSPDASGDGANDGGLDAVTQDSAADAPSSDAKPDSSTACPTTNDPEDVPSGWVRVPVFGCKYPIYAPPDASMLPPGLSWEECTDIGPDPYTCRQVVVDWPDPNPIGGTPVGHVLPDGNVLLGLRKTQVFTEASVKMFSHMDLLVEADGPVRQAFWVSKQPYSNGPFWFRPASISDSRSTWLAQELLGGKFVRLVNLGGPSSELIPPHPDRHACGRSRSRHGLHWRKLLCASRNIAQRA